MKTGTDSSDVLHMEQGMSRVVQYPASRDGEPDSPPRPPKGNPGLTATAVELEPEFRLCHRLFPF